MFAQLLVYFLLATPAQAAEVLVDSAGDLRAAIDSAAPGDEIVIAAGTYAISAPLYPDNAGEQALPITVRAESPGVVTLQVDTTMGFEVSAPWWVFEDLDIQGVCANHSDCEHAFHIISNADHTVVRGSVMRDWNAQIKGNGAIVDAAMVFPDDVLIENSEMYNSTIRDTGNPVTPIDVVGGQRWIVRANYIHDHAKGRSDQVSYAAFFKGNSADGLFERNLVVCESLHTGGYRLGLSLGGGGSYPDSICEQGDCSVEHTGGILRNNIIARCPADVGIYLNQAADTKVYNNLLYANTGIDVRFVQSTADIRNNLLSGEVRERDGGTATTSSNRRSVPASRWLEWFTDPEGLDFGLRDGSEIVDVGDNVPEVTDDFCTNDRDDGLTDLGPIEYDQDADCVTTAPFVARADDDGPGDTDDPDDTDVELGSRACGCDTGSGAGSLWLLLLAGALLRGRSWRGPGSGET